MIPLQYQLAETPSASYLQRTEWNVRDSDGTVIFTMAAKLAGGSKRTAEFAKKHGKPLLHISHAGSYERPGERLAAFVRENSIKTLNVAGSRGSKEPKVAAFVKKALEEAFYPRVSSSLAAAEAPSARSTDTASAGHWSALCPASHPSPAHTGCAAPVRGATPQIR